MSKERKFMPSNSKGTGTFSKTDTKLYVSVVSSLAITEGNAKLL